MATDDGRACCLTIDHAGSTSRLTQPPDSTPTTPAPRHRPHDRSIVRADSHTVALYRRFVRWRWQLVAWAWLAIGVPSAWALRQELGLWQQYFSWVSLRYAIVYHRWPAMGLGLCLGLTVALLVWQSRAMIWGLSVRDQAWLAQLDRRSPLKTSDRSGDQPGDRGK